MKPQPGASFGVCFFPNSRPRRRTQWKAWGLRWTRWQALDRPALGVVLPPSVELTVRYTTLFFVFAGLCVGPRLADAQSNGSGRRVLEIGDAHFRPYPIALPRAREISGPRTSGAANEVTATLRYSFELAASFKVLDPKSYLANPDKEGLAAASIRFDNWVNVGADGLVKCWVNTTPKTLRTDFRFYEVGSGREMLRKSYAGTPKDAKRFARKFADEVVYTLTGSRGVFGTRIAAVRRTKKGRELWVMDLDGSNLRPITKNGSINLLPSWARDGQSLIFTSYIRHNPNLYKVSVRGGQPRLLSGERGLNTGGTMSPDGKKIALTLSRTGNSEIFVMNADGTGLVQLTNEWAIDSSPSWSPDGKQIAFVSSRWGDPHIFVMKANGSGVRRITDRGTYNQTPDWSPEGDLIAFTARDERNVFDIFTVSPETKEIRRLTQDQGNNEEPSFSPDGRLIVFTSTRERGSHVWIMAKDGSNQRRISTRGSFSTPAWSPYLEY